MADTVQRRAAREYVSASCEATQGFGRACAEHATDGLVVILTGDLGAGKTQFTKGLADGLGSARDVTSPTFTIMQTYDDGRLSLYHFDLYRLDDPEQLGDAGVLDVCDGVMVCEWGETFADDITDDRVEATFTRLAGGGDGEPERLIALSATGPESEAFVAAVDRMMEEEA